MSIYYYYSAYSCLILYPIVYPSPVFLLTELGFLSLLVPFFSPPSPVASNALLPSGHCAAGLLISHFCVIGKFDHTWKYSKQTPDKRRDSLTASFPMQQSKQAQAYTRVLAGIQRSCAWRLTIKTFLGSRTASLFQLCTGRVKTTPWTTCSYSTQIVWGVQFENTCQELVSEQESHTLGRLLIHCSAQQPDELCWNYLPWPFGADITLGEKMKMLLC